jgi:hypothetical protein
MSADPVDLLKQLWSEGPLGPLVLVSSGGSVAAAGWLLWRAVTLPLNVVAFGEQVRKLLNAQNVERAIKLCNACGERPQGRLVKFGLEARVRGVSAMEALREARPGALAEMQRGLVPAMFVGSMSALASAALLATHMDARYFPVALGLALLDAGVLVFAARQWMNAVRDIDTLVQLTGDL